MRMREGWDRHLLFIGSASLSAALKSCCLSLPELPPLLSFHFITHSSSLLIYPKAFPHTYHWKFHVTAPKCPSRKVLWAKAPGIFRMKCKFMQMIFPYEGHLLSSVLLLLNLLKQQGRFENSIFLHRGMRREWETKLLYMRTGSHPKAMPAFFPSPTALLHLKTYTLQRFPTAEQGKEGLWEVQSSRYELLDFTSAWFMQTAQQKPASEPWYRCDRLLPWGVTISKPGFY